MLLTLADHLEAVARIIPNEIALNHAGMILSWAQYEQRAARLAQFLSNAGIGRGDKVALYSRNANEYLEAHLACLKIRAVPINVNYRYVGPEIRYLFDDADMRACFFQARFARVIAEVLPQLRQLRVLVEIADDSGQTLAGAVPFEQAVAANAPMAPITRSPDDHYIVYTGGTTGMPKGVVYSMESFYGRNARVFATNDLTRPTTEAELAEIILSLFEREGQRRSLPACPLMHGTALYMGVLFPQLLGGQVVTFDPPRFDPGMLWQVVASERISDLVVVGDVFATPMIAAWKQEIDASQRLDISSLRRIFSSGVMFSQEAKQGLLGICDATIFDGLGSTESSLAWSICSRSRPPLATAKFTPHDTTKVFTDDGREVQPGSGEVGALASGAAVPLGYYKDEAKSLQAFRTVNGQRYTFPGDMATIAADGTLVLLGRGSHCINSGGEKIYPEEVEEAIKSHPQVLDCLVFGEPDTRFGERVIAVVAADGDLDQASLLYELHGRIAAYKLPRDVLFTGEIQRGPNGKPDYAWARALFNQRSEAGC